MLHRFLAFFEDRLGAPGGPEGKHTYDEFHLAAAALLVYAATADADFDLLERERIEWLCQHRFNLDPEEVGALIADAEREVNNSVQLLRFTRTVKDGFSYEERVQLMEMLWEVVYADRRVEEHEAQLMRRIAGLIYVDDRDSGIARARVRARLESEDGDDGGG